MHESDLSAHCYLSLADAKEVLEKGWGERHRVSGNLIPLQYTFLYAPRNVGEVEVFIQIIEASVKYGASNGKKQ